MKYLSAALFIVSFSLVGCVRKTTPTSQLTPPESLVPSSQTEPEPLSEQQATDERYQVFTPQVLENAASSRRVLFFYANWCSTCRPADASFQTNSDQIPEDVTVIRVNYNDTDTDAAERALAARYNITYQHTFVQIDAQGNAIHTWNGGDIDAVVRNVQ